MGLLDGILGSVLGSALGGGNRAQPQDPLSAILGGLMGGNSGGGGGNMLLQLALSMLQQNGGLEGVLGKFRQGGMASQADSWVSTGQNLPVSPSQLEQIFGSGTISDIASKLGMSQQDAGSAMSQVLPELINQLTPQGQVTNESQSSIGDALNSLARSLGR